MQMTSKLIETAIIFKILEIFGWNTSLYIINYQYF